MSQIEMAQGPGNKWSGQGDSCDNNKITMSCEIIGVFAVEWNSALTSGVRQSSLSFLQETCSTESSIWLNNTAGMTGPTTAVISRNWILKIEVFDRAAPSE